MLSAPPLNRPNDDAVRRHYLRVAEAVPELPVVIQDLPALGVWMSPELIGRMAAEAPNLRVVKLEEEPTAPKVGRLLAVDPGLHVLGGLGGEMLIEELRRGAVGTMTGFGYPELLVAIMREWRAGEREAATRRFHRYTPLIRFENQALLNLPIRKHIYMRRGAIDSDKVRAPGPRAGRANEVGPGRPDPPARTRLVRRLAAGAARQKERPPACAGGLPCSVEGRVSGGGPH